MKARGLHLRHTYCIFKLLLLVSMRVCVIPHTGKNSNDVNSYQQENFKIESSVLASHNHWMGIGIVNDTNSTVIFLLEIIAAALISPLF